MGSLSGLSDARDSLRRALAVGLVGGLVAGVGMGVVLHAGGNMMLLIGSLYGWPSVVGGWTAHLLNSVGLGAMFAAVLSHRLFEDQTETVVGCVTLGMGYAAMIGLVTGGLMLPAAVSAVGAESLPSPLLPLPGVVGGAVVVASVGIAHLVYGILLGATYGIVHNEVAVRELARAPDY